MKGSVNEETYSYILELSTSYLAQESSQHTPLLTQKTSKLYQTQTTATLQPQQQFKKNNKKTLQQDYRKKWWEAPKITNKQEK